MVKYVVMVYVEVSIRGGSVIRRSGIRGGAYTCLV